MDLTQQVAQLSNEVRKSRRWNWITWMAIGVFAASGAAFQAAPSQNVNGTLTVSPKDGIAQMIIGNKAGIHFLLKATEKTATLQIIDGAIGEIDVATILADKGVQGGMSEFRLRPWASNPVAKKEVFLRVNDGSGEKQLP